MQGDDLSISSLLSSFAAHFQKRLGALLVAYESQQDAMDENKKSLERLYILVADQKKQIKSLKRQEHLLFETLIISQPSDDLKTGERLMVTEYLGLGEQDLSKQARLLQVTVDGIPQRNDEVGRGDYLVYEDVDLSTVIRFHDVLAPGAIVTLTAVRR